MLTQDSRFHPNDMECASKVIDGEAVIINLSNGTYYSLDQVGALIWELIGDGWTLAEIGGAVAARYDVTPERAAGRRRAAAGGADRGEAARPGGDRGAEGAGGPCPGAGEPAAVRGARAHHVPRHGRPALPRPAAPAPRGRGVERARRARGPAALGLSTAP